MLWKLSRWLGTFFLFYSVAKYHWTDNYYFAGLIVIVLLGISVRLEFWWKGVPWELSNRSAVRERIRAKLELPPV